MEIDPFDGQLSVRDNLIIARDMMHIRFRYFKHRGFKNITRLKKQRILNAFDDYIKSCLCYNSKGTMNEWKEFIETFNQDDGIEFFELHAWL